MTEPLDVVKRFDELLSEELKKGQFGGNHRAALLTLAREIRREAWEQAAKVCEELWLNAPSGKEQNGLSHGCVACAAAIRSLEDR